MSSNTNKNLYYTVPLDDDLESQATFKRRKAPWLSVPIRSAAPSRSPLSILKERFWSWSNDDTHHLLHSSNSNARSAGRKGFWDRWIWLVHAVLLTTSMTLFALSMCTLQTAASASTTASAAVQCQCQGTGSSSAAAGGMDGASSTSSSLVVPRSFFDDDEKETSAPPAVVLPVPIAVDIPESKHVNMEVSVDDKTWVEEGEEDEE
ncbi:unnamed protein product [Sordaria macrospora k-hell]|uniref:WGS project CABT00000000 data, contig 2.39 n=1 Tax=Sordaria macrospora (strain ATCC MYA-333 / DSM 997 / K(L3346) / K-hell) TaxID=771870 RepID=F7W7K2_SORMK|nr:uncharacterized protein SMAC_07110 [Sordaria macrospora k-hell]CCC13486.1 unnamed protein product [Sordaria macrospora k-hell]